VPVFRAVGGVDLVVDVVAGFDETDVLVDAAGADVTFVPVLRAAEPVRRAPLH
jgi:hypothetical protein